MKEGRSGSLPNNYYKLSPHKGNISKFKVLSDFCRNNPDTTQIGNNISIHEVISKRKTQNQFTKLYSTYNDINPIKSRSPISDRSHQKTEYFKKGSKTQRHDISHIHDIVTSRKNTESKKHYLVNLNKKSEELKNTLTVFKESIPNLTQVQRKSENPYQDIKRNFSDVLKNFHLDKKLPQIFTKSSGNSRMESKMVSSLLQESKGKGESAVQLVHVLFWELQRQIKIECHERGTALAHLWEERNNMEQMYLEEIDQIKESNDDRIKDEYNRVNSLCNRIIEKEKEKTEEANVRILSLQERNQYLEKEMDYKLESDKKFTSKINELSTIKELLYKKCKDLIKETKSLNARLEYTPKQRVKEQDSLSSLSMNSLHEKEEFSNNAIEREKNETEMSIGNILAEDNIDGLNDVNFNFIPDKPREDMVRSTGVQVDLGDLGKTVESEIQTNLSLVSKAFDFVSTNNEVLLEFVENFNLKNELEGIGNQKEILELLDSPYNDESEISKRDSASSIKTGVEELKRKRSLMLFNRGSTESMGFNPVENLMSSSLEEIKEEKSPLIQITTEFKRKKSLFYQQKLQFSEKIESSDEISNNQSFNSFSENDDEEDENLQKQNLELMQKNLAMNLFLDNSLKPPQLNQRIQSRSSTIAIKRTQEIEETKRKKILTQFLKSPPDSKKFLQLIKLYKSEYEKNVVHQSKIENLNKELGTLKEDLELKISNISEIDSQNKNLKEEINTLKIKIDQVSNSYQSYDPIESPQPKSKTNLDAHSRRGKVSNWPSISDLKHNNIRKSMAKTSNKEESFNAPNLGQKVEYELGKKVEFGRQIVEKLDSKKMAKFKNFMHPKILLKTIYNLYIARIAEIKEKSGTKDKDFADFCYNHFSKLFGFKSIADQRFIIFILSLKKNVNYFRINVFAKFLGLLPSPAVFSLEELNKYLEGLDYILNQSNLGNPILNNESEMRFFVPYIRALQYTGVFADSRTTPEENQEFIKEIEKLKEPDPSNQNKAGIIDFDYFMEKVLKKYRILLNKAKLYVINAFAASDLDGNGMCNIDEFLLLNKHIESEKYNEEELTKIFEENADIEEEGEKNLSFDKFSVVCVDFNLFSDRRQNEFLEIRSDREISKKFQELKGIWPAKKEEILDRFDRINILAESEVENWLNIIEVLNERINLEEKEVSIKPVLIAYKILENTSKEYYDRQIEEEEKCQMDLSIE